jgi:hypothetical protein
MLDPLDATLEKIQDKLSKLEGIYHATAEGKSVASGVIEDYQDSFVEAIALKALDPQFNVAETLKGVARNMTNCAECKEGATVAPDQLDAIVTEAVSEIRHGQLKVQPRKGRGTHR